MTVAELREWLEAEIQFNIGLADEFKEVEDSLRATMGEYPATMSTVHYQIAVAFRKCLQKVNQLDNRE